jgi:hypothetical protein
MQQLKNKRTQDKIFKKVKILSILTSAFMLFLITEFAYNNFIKDKSLFINPLSSQSSNKLGDFLNQRNIPYKNLEEGSNYYVLELDQGQIVIISKNKDIGEQLSSLQLIQSRLKIEGRDFKSLDMRFAQPVIKQ